MERADRSFAQLPDASNPSARKEITASLPASGEGSFEVNRNKLVIGLHVTRRGSTHGEQLDGEWHSRIIPLWRTTVVLSLGVQGEFASHSTSLELSSTLSV